MIISYYGDGKGKTTAALGLATRAAGRDKKVLFAQFIKGDQITGEDIALKKIKLIVHKKFGLGFVGIMGDQKPLQDHQKAALEGLRYISNAFQKFDVIVLDEVFGAIDCQLIDENEICKLIQDMPKNIDLVLTGRPKISKLLRLSDLVTEMKKIKHPFDKGIQAKIGIDL